ncbi:helix-turn-helix domain-containing protein [Actinomadura monticuli]|uniref:helix-turn-helix domain-containing protein n=1 Tax=Actinomadura monticuli TaxID=3097367 RepID=UPI003561ADB3
MPRKRRNAPAERFRARGLLGESLTPEGEAFRRGIEDRTDELALPAPLTCGVLLL